MKKKRLRRSTNTTTGGKRVMNDEYYISKTLRSNTKHN